jgi:ribulose kinase
VRLGLSYLRPRSLNWRYRYAGWLGTVAARSGDAPAPAVAESRHRLAAVAGTSTCYIANTPAAEFVPGVWGPYRDAVFPGWWMSEGGQSATGQLIEHVITSHPAAAEARGVGEREGKEVYDVLRDVLEQTRKERGLENVTEVTKDLHFYPDLHGGLRSRPRWVTKLTTMML